MENQNVDFYKDIRDILNQRKSETGENELKEIQETLINNSVGNKAYKVKRKKMNQMISDRVAGVFLASVAISCFGIMIGVKANVSNQIQNEINDIKSVVRDYNPDASEKELDVAAKDIYYVLNSYRNTGDKSATNQIYNAYLHGKENADIVLESSYEISNNEEKYSFVPEGGYQVEINAVNMDQYVSISFPELELEDKYKLYEEYMERKISQQHKEAFEIAENGSKKM